MDFINDKQLKDLETHWKKKYKEIAEELEISIKTVEKRIHDALLFLRSEIVELKKY